MAKNLLYVVTVTFYQQYLISSSLKLNPVRTGRGTAKHEEALSCVHLRKSDELWHTTTWNENQTQRCTSQTFLQHHFRYLRGGLDFLCLFLVMESHLCPSDQSHKFPHQHVYCLSASPLKSHRQCSNNLQIIPALIGYRIISTSRIARRLGAGAHISANRIILTRSHCANGCIITMFLERTPNVVVLKWLCTHIYLHEIQISCIFSSYGDDQMSGCEQENKFQRRVMAAISIILAWTLRLWTSIKAQAALSSFMMGVLAWLSLAWKTQNAILLESLKLLFLDNYRAPNCINEAFQTFRATIKGLFSHCAKSACHLITT